MVWHQRLNDKDPARRCAFARFMLRRLKKEPTFFENCLISDECLFRTAGICNRQNYRFWAKEISEVKYDLNATGSSNSKTGIMVWMGIWKKQLVGPFFFEKNVTGKRYAAMLKRKMVPALRKMHPKLWRRQCYFQQDGAGPHFETKVREWLNKTFSNKWIGRGAPDDRNLHDWPARSPDLSPCDFFLWGYLKYKVYDPKLPKLALNDVEELKRRIIKACETITPEMLDRVNIGWKLRMEACIEENGKIFEHILKKKKAKKSQSEP